MNGVISSRHMLPRFVHFIDERYNGHVVTYHLQSNCLLIKAVLGILRLHLVKLERTKPI